MQLYHLRILLLVCAILAGWNAMGQSSYVGVHDKEYQHMIERMDVKLSLKQPFLHTTSRPYQRKSIAALADSVWLDTNISLSSQDMFNLQYLANDNAEWSNLDSNESKKPILKRIYQRKSDMFHVDTEDFDLHVNPVLYLSLGSSRGDSSMLYVNTRGVEIRGMINKRIGFYTFFSENQARFPSYVNNFLNFPAVPGVPGEGYTKGLKNNGVDFITARGYFTFNIIKNIQFQFGHDKNFIGNGYRSLMLSDFSSNYTFLKLNTQVWKINYVNIFAEMNADVFYRNELMPKKYFALHHLNFQVNKNISIGLFESVIFGRRDSSKIGHFDFNYLNPVIFYRSIEQQLGSEDNALLGIDTKINFLKRFSFYGQFILDEFVLTEVKKGNGWSGNKQAGQLGLKYFDVAGISNLDLQIETNIVRPYTFSHKDRYRSYTHYNQPLAHPYGANFTEFVGIARYQPLKRLKTTAKIITVNYGADTSFRAEGTDNMGGNIFKNYETAPAYFGNKIGQGIPSKLFYFSLDFSYQVKHNLFLDFTTIVRKHESGIEKLNTNSLMFLFTLRLNAPQRLHEF